MSEAAELPLIQSRNWMSLQRGEKGIVKGLLKGKKGSSFVIIYQDNDHSVIIDLIDKEGLDLDVDPCVLVNVEIVATRQQGLTASTNDIKII